MRPPTPQISYWTSEFGKAYTDRNAISPEELDESYRKKYGTTRTELNLRFLNGLDHAIRILEVGSGIGNQLLILQRMGFQKLYGIDVQAYAVELSKARTRGINIIESSAFDIPFKDACFHLVFTSGLLIHISPFDISSVLREIYRCSSDYIWGFEYYSDEYTEVTYRGYEDLLWKADFSKLYRRAFDDLELVREERLEYLDNDNIDSMFLLRRKPHADWVRK